MDFCSRNFYRNDYVQGENRWRKTNGKHGVRDDHLQIRGVSLAQLKANMQKSHHDWIQLILSTVGVLVFVLKNTVLPNKLHPDILMPR